MFKPVVLKEKTIYSFSNILTLTIVVSGFMYLFIGDDRELVTGMIALVTTTLLTSIFLGIIFEKDEEIRQLHFEAKLLALKKSGDELLAAEDKNTQVEIINTENISGNVVADKLVAGVAPSKPKTIRKK